MSDNVIFEDNSIQVKNLIKETALIFLHDAGQELKNAVIREYDTTTDTGQTKGSFGEPVIDDSNLVCYMGSDHPNAIWEEFGTGEFAENGDGRKGYWVFVKGSSGQGQTKGGKSYSSKEEAKKAMAILRSKGLEAYYTKGKHARHQFRNAYNSIRSKIIKHAEQLFGGLSS